MNVYAVSKVRLDHDGRVIAVFWGRVNTDTNQWATPEVLAPVREVVDAIRAGDQVYALFPSTHGHLPDRPFMIVAYDNGWATISLYGHAPEVQVSRWGLPLVTHLFLNDPNDQSVKEQFNTSEPFDDVGRFSKPIGEFAEKMASYAGSVADPVEYGKLVAARLCPNLLPYELGTPAAFEQASFNGRALADDVMDVMLTLAAKRALSDGVAPDPARIRKEFPYYGEPYSAEEQAGVTPVPRPAKK